MCMERRRFSQTMTSLPNGKLLLLSLTKCHVVPCSLLSRITTKVLKNCKTFSSRPRPTSNVQDFMIQDQDFHFCPCGASRPRRWSRGLHHWKELTLCGNDSKVTRSGQSAYDITLSHHVGLTVS